MNTKNDGIQKFYDNQTLMCAAPVESTGSKLEVFLDNVNHMQLNRKYMHIATWKAYHMICVLKFWRIHIKCLIILFFGYQKLVLLVIMVAVKISTYRFLIMVWKYRPTDLCFENPLTFIVPLQFRVHYVKSNVHYVLYISYENFTFVIHFIIFVHFIPHPAGLHS